MQMIDGKHLSGDHSFKMTKCIMSNGSKTFTAMYTLMNEYGQVVAFWFTTGTGMKELEECVKQLKFRYENFGFEGPYSFTTDRCCQERRYWNENLRFADATDAASRVAAEEDEEEDSRNVANKVSVTFVSLPRPPRVAVSKPVADAFVDEISAKLQEEPVNERAFAWDCEWILGSMNADTLQIGLRGGDTYVFHLYKICRGGGEFPTALKTLLENVTVSKVGNRVHSDVKAMRGWGVEVNCTVELGHVAHARGLCGKAPSLEFLVELL